MKLSRRLRSLAFGPIPLSRERAIGASERLSATTTLISSLEYLSQRQETRRGGLNDWQRLRHSYADTSPVTRKVLDAVSGPRTTTVLHVTRAAVSAGLLLPGSSRWRGAGGLFLGLSAIALQPRHRYGTDGSDQVAILAQVSTGLARTSTSPQTQDALLWFMAVQSNLSYAVAGWAKLLGESWRDASALPGILRTRTYGCEPVFRFAQTHPRASKALTHGVLALECLFPVVYLAGGRLARPVLGGAAAFHVGNGFIMGLGRFLTSFVSLHPAVAYTSAPKSHPAVATRDDRAVLAAGLALAGTAVLAGAGAVQRRLRVLDGWEFSRTLTTRHGNRIQYEAGAGTAPRRPVLVFVPGLAATSEHFGRLTDHLLRETGCGVVTYARPGYAGSRRSCTAPYSLAESVDELVDLVDAAVPADRDVVIVGHSLGGELARRAAPRLGNRLRAVVYLDSAHPGEINRSRQQDESSKRLRLALPLMAWSLRAGTGALLSRPAWVEGLPLSYRQRAFDQYADARLWKASHREWRAVEEDFRAFTGGLTPVPGDGLVVSAQHTVDRDPEQLRMHHELAQAHRDSGAYAHTVVLKGADHDSLLTDGRYAGEIVRHIARLLAGSPDGSSGQDEGSRDVRDMKGHR